MRLGIFQGPEKTEDAADALAALDGAARTFAAGGEGLLIMPELFLTGYNIGAAGLRERAEAQDGPSAQAAADIARRHGIALLYGYPEAGGGDAVYNSALLLGADGQRLANYRKLHLFGRLERAAFTVGEDSFVLAELFGMRVGILICYDVEFPEMVRGLATRGADLVVVPTALMQPYGFVAEVLVRARAYESQVYLAYANRCGIECDLNYVGQSCIVGPDGADLARAGTGQQLITASLDRDALARSRKLLPYLRDLLPDRYARDEAGG